MKYDFTTIIKRKGMDALAVDNVGMEGDFAPGAPKDGFDIIPMWVADMNFATAPSVVNAIEERLKHPVFGYFSPRDEYFDAIKKWHGTRKGVTDIENNHIGYENSVLGGLMSAVNALCSRGDKILLHSPTYIGFKGCLQNNGYNIIYTDMVKDENGLYRMDFEDMEEKLKRHHIHMAIFCSPHNPTGRVFEAWEIERAMEIYKKYDVHVISDEIWSDIILGDNHHIPTQSVSEDAKNRTIALYAPSKTFNLAGLIGSYHIIYNSYLKDRVIKEASLSHYNQMNILSMYSLIGAYSEVGQAWTDELCQVLTRNVRMAGDYITERFEGVSVPKTEGTYMLFADCKEFMASHGLSLKELLQSLWDVGVAVQSGDNFNGPTHIRINLASPQSMIEEALERMDKYVFNK